jgi:hypothetical protein
MNLHMQKWNGMPRNSCKLKAYKKGISGMDFSSSFIDFPVARVLRDCYIRNK